MNVDMILFQILLLILVVIIYLGFRNSLTPFPLDDKETKFILDMPGRRT